MLFLAMIFVLLCIAAGTIPCIGAVRHLRLHLNVVLIVISVGLFALWYGLNSYSPPLTIREHWRMVIICLTGFLSMLVSAVAALKNLSGVRSGIVAPISIGIGLLHFLDLVVSLPVS
jgi:CDP-diglyceride synthetase